MTIRRRLLRFVRKLHIWVGLSAALYFMLIAATGVMINHREGLLLEDRTISRRWLPSSYRPDDGKEGVRADIAVADPATFPQPRQSQERLNAWPHAALISAGSACYALHTSCHRQPKLS